VNKHFTTINVVDFEYEIEAGGLPRVLCMVVWVLNENLQQVHAIRMWRGEFGSTAPFDIGPDTLFVAYSAWAEMTCFIVLGWPFPIHVFDLHTAYLAASNILLPHGPDEVRKRPRKGLSDACRAYGIDGWENIDKPVIAKAIAEGRWREYGKQAVLDYCEEDVKNSVKLLRAQLRCYCDQSGRTLLPAADVPHVLHWSNYSAKAVARIQARGMPIDIALWNLVQENRRSVIGELLRQFDPSYNSENPIFGRDGEWSYARFEYWLVRCGVPYWPRLESGKLNIDSDAFRMMGHIPGIAGIHALRDSIGFIARVNYGMGVPSLARGLNRHPLIASGIIEKHRQEYPRYWQWRENVVEVAMLDRKIESVYGWPLRISTSPNIRTLYNFPMQSGGAEMLRLAVWRMCEVGIVPIMLIHDGILLEETDLERIEHAREIMLQAGRDVCDGFEIGVDIDQLLKGGARYYDKRPMAKQMWATIMRALTSIGALPERGAA
jgi:hypothetical protein